MNQFLLFTIFWLVGIVVMLLGLYVWYSYWNGRKIEKLKKEKTPPPKPKMIEFHKLD